MIEIYTYKENSDSPNIEYHVYFKDLYLNVVNDCHFLGWTYQEKIFDTKTNSFIVLCKTDSPAAEFLYFYINDSVPMTGATLIINHKIMHHVISRCLVKLENNTAEYLFEEQGRLNRSTLKEIFINQLLIESALYKP